MEIIMRQGYAYCSSSFIRHYLEHHNHYLNPAYDHQLARSNQVHFTLMIGKWDYAYFNQEASNYLDLKVDRLH